MSALDRKIAVAKALIFDCDGTLIDSEPVYAVAWAKGFGLSGKTMDAQWYHGRNGLSEPVLMEAFERLHGIEAAAAAGMAV